MLTADQLEERRGLIAESDDLRALLERLQARAAEVVERRPLLPAGKGMLSADGGFCPEDGAGLRYDPWSPSRHLCPRCGKHWTGERHDQWWAWHQHLWLGERIAHLAAVGALAQDEAALEWSAATLAEYARRYPEYPNADNVLGPTRLFFSTYLESVWLTNVVAGAMLLRETGVLDEDAISAVTAMVEESANLIGDFDEGLSNRQTWHNAALAAAACWFEDEELARRAIEGPRGLVGHLVDGFRADGLWYEGENYHLFALRGLLIGAEWARMAGVDFFEDDASRARLHAALRAPALTALPDGTFPARKDSRFGVSPAQPMYLELWEAGIPGLLIQGEEEAAAELGGWLGHLYRQPAPAAETFDAWLQEAGEEAPAHRGRADLGWWMLCVMAPALPGGDAEWRPESALLEDQGLAVLRGPASYVSMECGPYGGGHGHPDRLHLTAFADGVHWLADPGTGSYVARDLFWYRSTLAHNAPRLDGVSQPQGDARCETFDSREGWGWVRGRYDRFTRTVVAGPDHLVDVLEFADDQEHLVELPLHPLGEIALLTEGRWESAGTGGDFLSAVERFVPAAQGPIRWEAVLPAGRRLRGICDPGGELWRATGPSRPGQGERPFLLRRLTGRYVRATCVMAWSGAPLTEAEFAPEQVVVRTEAGAVTHHQISDGWEIQDGDHQVTLRGGRRTGLAELEFPGVGRELLKYTPPVATAYHMAEPPGNGTTGFTTHEAIQLDHEDQYRRSEEPYGGPEDFSAQAWLGWDEQSLYLSVAVRQEDPVFRPSGAPPLRLDNEPDLIHADGIQVFLALGDHPLHGWLLVPDPDSTGLQVHPIGGTAARADQVRGGWARTPEGYTITVGLSIPDWPPVRGDAAPAFDLLVNQMRPDRLRRLGQLVWTGGGGWVYLRGDRPDPERFGRLELV